MQGDGNLVLYEGGKPMWASDTSGRSAECDNLGCKAQFQTDGNLVIYVGGKPIWASHTAGKGVTFTFEKDAPFIRIRDAAGNVIWNGQR